METVATLNPRDVGVGFQLALLYYRNDQKEDAIKLLESVVALSPNYSNAHWYLATMYDERGDIDKAIAEMEKVLELNADNQQVVDKLAELRLKKSQPPVAGQTGELPPPVTQPLENAGQPAVGQ